MGFIGGGYSGDPIVEAWPLPTDIGHVVGTAETLLTRPVGAEVLFLHFQTEGSVGTGVFRIRPGDYRAKTFTADNTTDRLTITAHGLSTGDGPYKVSNSGGALPTGLSATTLYWIIVVDVNTVKLATSQALAQAGTAVDFTTNGTGTQTLGGMPGAPAASTTDNYGSLKLALGSRFAFTAPKTVTVVGGNAGDILTYYWA